MRGIVLGLLYIFVLLALGIAIWVGSQRLSWEASYRTVGFAIPYQELDGLDESKLLEHLAQLRVQGVVALTIELSALPDWNLNRVLFNERLFKVARLAGEVGLTLAFVVEAADAAVVYESAQTISNVLDIKPKFLLVIATSGAPAPSWTPAELRQILSGPEPLVGFVEFSEPKGLLALYKQRWHGFVRVHAIKSRELSSLNLDRTLARWERAVHERNIRLLWVTEHQRFLDYLEQLSQRVRGLGFELGQPFTPMPFQNLYAVYLLVGLGIVSLLLLVTVSFLKMGLTLLISLIVVGFAAVALGGIWDLAVARQMLALALALLAPWSLIALIIRRLPTLVLLLVVSAGSVAAGLGIAALLSDVTYFIKLDEFRGVKMALIAPSLLVITVELLRWGRPGRVAVKKQLKRRAWLVPAVGLGALFFVLERSGNLTLIPRWEEFLRERLESWLIARPRFKEFLIGHPALVVWGAQCSQSPNLLNLSLLALGVLGQASIINTFAHLHTPLVLSLWRTLNGLAIGAFVGMVLVGGLHLLKWLRSRRS